MRNTIWQKRIPTLLGILFITIGIGITTYLIKTGVLFTTKAGPSEDPHNVRITNITDSSFTVSYTTANKVVGSVNYGRDQDLSQITLDDRDENGTVSNFSIHYITVKNLEPQTTYYLSINSGGETFTQDGSLYRIQTVSPIPRLGEEDKLISGKILFPDSSTREALVYISADETNTISTLVKEDGTYSILLNLLRGKDMSSYYSLSEQTPFRMLVEGQKESSNVRFNIPPSGALPDIGLGNEYDFTSENLPEATQSAASIFSSLDLQGQTSPMPKISIPKENQTFTDNQPKFTGTAVPQSSIEIVIHSDENIRTQVTADLRGNWSFRPSLPLSPGVHTITIIARDAGGILRTITQSFTIFESGTQVAEAATPSATPVVTITPTPTPTMQPTPTTVIITPTPTTPPQVTIVPSPTIPPPGNSSALLLGILGVGLSVLGFFILLLSRGASSL
ncbi:MAG: hypothetical protein A2958_00955 [Candidatus Levybacteria bacterium RIFCSPLOWO2_01_FULL_38_13]|nr:MAG: hypothetical protein A2629_00850 [Candidatus Levybacteria bacterium RIFCSPHIGHO2_01_FULL_41_15]OGH34856.1 MAG: hypothetical protein A2958_00955 [Candidatus Levybacteria bacterium RIFCSPLOWO2_01_FULL_38_13]